MVINPGEQTMTMLKRIFANGWQSISGVLASFAALLAPAVPAIITAFLFIFVDAYYGYKVSKKYGHKQIESNKIWKTINKLTEAGLIIVLGLFIDKYIFLNPDELNAVRVAAGAVCTAELFSLLESLRALHPRAILSRILQKIIKSKSEKYLDVDITDILEEHNTIANDTNTDKSNKKINK